MPNPSFCGTPISPDILLSCNHAWVGVGVQCWGSCVIDYRAVPSRDLRVYRLASPSPTVVFPLPKPVIPRRPFNGSIWSTMHDRWIRISIIAAGPVGISWKYLSSKPVAMPGDSGGAIVDDFGILWGVMRTKLTGYSAQSIETQRLIDKLIVEMGGQPRI